MRGGSALTRAAAGRQMNEDELVEKILTRRRRAIERMSTSYMSNAKWPKALEALTPARPGGFCRWKLAHHEKVFSGSLPLSIEEIPESHVCCSMIDAYFWMHPRYADVEWLEILTAFTWQPYENAPLSHHSIDVTPIHAALDAAGPFETELKHDCIRIYGYRP